ncbi:MFS transporter [Almyronema epifaneia]|uniref:MFS transporter n=1 Tax=Almyronema epifaneia S1 TaxID=2991925 RepID=A0ABW6IFX1_9CYAN
MANRVWGAFEKVQRWLPALDARVWLLAGGRLLSQIGIGFTLFYAPIFFVDQVGLSATQVGLGIGIGAIAGLIGRFWGGSMADSPQWGRRKTLLLSAAISAIADAILFTADNFPLFTLGNVVMDFGVGLYWPATEAVVADITVAEQRNEAFAIVRLADSIGLGLGVVMGGALISLTGLYRALFAIDGVTFLLFFGVIYWAIAETLPDQPTDSPFFEGWGVALRDLNLLTYVTVNIFFTSYLAQMQSTLPVYFNQFVSVGDSGKGLSEATLSVLFTGYVVLTALCQLPMARRLKGLRLPRALMFSACAWGVGFVFIYLAGTLTTLPLLWAVLALSTMAIATVAYTPISSAIIVYMARDDLRGVYLSVNSMCWALGYLIGPPLGGWALDQPRAIADGFWLAAALSVGGAIAILHILDRRLVHP